MPYPRSRSLITAAMADVAPETVAATRETPATPDMSAPSGADFGDSVDLLTTGFMGSVMPTIDDLKTQLEEIT